MLIHYDSDLPFSCTYSHLEALHNHLHLILPTPPASVIALAVSPIHALRFELCLREQRLIVATVSRLPSLVYVRFLKSIIIIDIATLMWDECVACDAGGKRKGL